MTLRLILMRHAKSSWDDPTWEDHERPLNDRGRASSAALGKWLKQKGYLPELVLCSTAVRTRETLDGLGLKLPVKYLDRLYHASTGLMLETLHEEAALDCVLMITHNPGCADFADRIVAAPPPHPRFSDYPTGATLVVEFDTDEWEEIDFHQGKVVDFVVPRELTD
jgi:phosphohistidine phosphatase